MAAITMASYTTPGDTIKINLSKAEDLASLNRFVYTFSDVAGIDLDPLSNTDFFARLTICCANRLGLVIELLIEAFKMAKLVGATAIDCDHFMKHLPTFMIWI